MSASPNDQEFLAAVKSLETCLMTPRISGELERWVDAVESAINCVGTALVRQINQEHRAEFRQITSDDPELHSRVERLKSGDTHSLEQDRSLRDRIHSVKKNVLRIEPDEGRLEPALVEFCADGLAYVLHLRKQEVAIETWLQESFSRDRGTGD